MFVCCLFFVHVCCRCLLCVECCSLFFVLRYVSFVVFFPLPSFVVVCRLLFVVYWLLFFLLVVIVVVVVCCC